MITKSISEAIDLKVIQSLIQQFDIVNSFQDSTSSLEEPDEVPPVPDALLNPVELTEEEQEAKKIFESASAILAKPKPSKEKAVQLLMEASNKGNLDAKGAIAWIKLFGNPLKQDLHVAKEMFVDLAEQGHHEGHMGLGKASYFLVIDYKSFIFRFPLCLWISSQCEPSKGTCSLYICCHWWKYLGQYGIRL